MKATFTLAAVLCAYLLVHSAVALPLSAEFSESGEQQPQQNGHKNKIPPVTIDAHMQATAHIKVPEEVLAAITKLVFKLQEEQKKHGVPEQGEQPQKVEKPDQGEEPAQGDEPQKVEQPAQGEEPQNVEQPAEEPQKVEQPEKSEQPEEKEQ